MKLTDLETSTRFLKNMLMYANPFLFAKHGDGALECIYKKRPGGATCDRERYTTDLGQSLVGAIISQVNGDPSRVFLGDWLTANFDNPNTSKYEPEWGDLTAEAKCSFLHFETLLLRNTPECVDFYAVLRSDRRTKLYMGPAEMFEAAKWLGAEHFVIPMSHNLYRHIPFMQARLKRFDYDVLIYGAGMAGQVPVAAAAVARPDLTYINIGSALDPLFWKKTRTEQLSQKELRRIFA